MLRRGRGSWGRRKVRSRARHHNLCWGSCCFKHRTRAKPDMHSGHQSATSELHSLNLPTSTTWPLTMLLELLSSSMVLSSYCRAAAMQFSALGSLPVLFEPPNSHLFCWSQLQSHSSEFSSDPAHSVPEPRPLDLSPGLWPFLLCYKLSVP